MSTLSKIVPGVMGALRPRPSIGDAVNDEAAPDLVYLADHVAAV